MPETRCSVRHARSERRNVCSRAQDHCLPGHCMQTNNMPARTYSQGPPISANCGCQVQQLQQWRFLQNWRRGSQGQITSSTAICPPILQLLHVREVPVLHVSPNDVTYHGVMPELDRLPPTPKPQPQQCEHATVHDTSIAAHHALSPYQQHPPALNHTDTWSTPLHISTQ